MPTEIKAQNTTTLASVKAIYDAADQANTLLDGMRAAATAAGTTLNDIYQDAADAQTAADRAEGKADDAADAADAAQASATTANAAANGALDSLSTVQDVIGVLDWASKNAEFERTADTTIQRGKTYWTRSGAGTEADPYVYTPVVNPVVADIGTYYEISSVDEAMADYINSHLALTDEGLYVLADNSEWKVLIANDGVYIKNSAGQTVGEFSKDGIRLGDVNGMNYMSITSGGLSLTLDGGLTDAIAAMLVAGDPSSWTTTENNILLPAKTDQGISVQNFYLRSQIAEGTTISFSVTLKSPADTGTTYTETYTFTQGSFDEYNGFVYEDKFVRFMYQGGSAITILSYYTWDTLITVATATYDIQIDRSEYFTFGKRRVNSAIGKYSLAEGYNVEASGDYSHAEGVYTIASAKEAHAEGNNTRATGDYSHAQNFYTKAASDYQTSLGKYNIEDNADTYAVIVGNGTDDNARSNALTIDWNGVVDTKGDVNIASGKHYKINGSNLAAADVGALASTTTYVSGVKGNAESSYRSGNVNVTPDNVGAVALTDKYTRSSNGTLDWSTQTEGDSKVIAKSALAFWNGAYSGNSSNLSKCSTGNIVGSNGGTMTGQLKTSFKTSVAMGSYGSAQTTVDGLVGEVRFSSGCTGSASINTAYTNSGITIPTGWYNFMYMPHRSGGNSGAADGDNANYGNLFLFGMNNTNGRFIVRVSSGAVADVCKIWTSLETAYGELYGMSSSLTLSTSAKKVALTTFNGIGCSLSSNGIKVTNAGTYMISGSAYCSTGYTVNDLIHIQLYKGSTSLCDSVRRALTANPYEIMPVGPIIVTLAANDVIYLYAYNQGGARGTVATNTLTHITLHRIA